MTIYVTPYGNTFDNIFSELIAVERSYCAK